MASSASRPGTATATSRPITGRSRPKTPATSTGHGYLNDDVICAVAESRGVSPSVGLAVVNLSTCEAVLCQFTDTQTFARTCHKIKVFGPTEILYASPAADSKFIAILHENLEVDKGEVYMTKLDRGYWSEARGLEYIKTLALPQDYEALRRSSAGSYFAVCCFAAASRFLEMGRGITFAHRSVRIKFESSEGAMMIDISTMASLELVQNQQNPTSKDCLYGFLSNTQTRMGGRLLKNNILQPSTDPTKIQQRWAVVAELSTKEETFYMIREALKNFVDADNVLADFVISIKKPVFQYIDEAVNKVLLLKSFVSSIQPVWQAMEGVSSIELQQIRELCNIDNYMEVQELLAYALSDDASYSQNAIDLRNQRVFAIRSGTNDFLDVARQSYTELLGDAKSLVNDLQAQVEIPLELKSEATRQFYIKIRAIDINASQGLPEQFINICHKTKAKNKFIECQTLTLVKLNQRINDTHNEILALSDATVKTLIGTIHAKLAPLYKISESIALLDLLTSFAYLVTSAPVVYTHPEICSGTIAIRSGRHPIREKLQSSLTNQKYIANDVYATQEHKRFQIITGCNMSGKSTYIRSIALMTIMAQIGCFVPAEHASFPIVHQLFARVATDDCLEANVSTFAAEMREMAFILRNIEPRSLVIIDELGRGTSTTDGLAIAVAIAEALIQSRAFVWFVTHFRDLSRILAERVGVYNLHMDVDMDEDFGRMKMKYKVSQGYEEQKFYGLALAQLVDLPDEILDTAVQVSKALHAQNDAKRSNTRTVLLARKRKLAVHMKETLIQARDGSLEGHELLHRLKTLQAEFAMRMLAIDSELESIQDSQVQTQDQGSESIDENIEHQQRKFALLSDDRKNVNSEANSDTEDMEMLSPALTTTKDTNPEVHGTGSLADPFQL